MLEGWCFDFRIKIPRKKPNNLHQLLSRLVHNGPHQWESSRASPGPWEQLPGCAAENANKTNSWGEERINSGLSQSFPRFIIPSQVDTSQPGLVLQSNVGKPSSSSFLYGADVIPIDPTTVVARTPLGVPKSSINEVLELEMGFKPMILRTLTAKVTFYLKVKEGHSACQMTQTCFKLLLKINKAEYLTNLNSLLAPYGLTGEVLTSSSVLDIEEHIFSSINRSIQLKSSLNLLPVPSKFWKMSPHVEEGLRS